MYSRSVGSTFYKVALNLIEEKRLPLLGNKTPILRELKHVPLIIVRVHGGGRTAGEG